jgi:hypothetical protein
MIKKLVLAILLVYSTAVSAQNVNPESGTVSTTGNLIDPNAWTGVIYMTPAQLAQVEGTGGGPIPAFNTATNTIRYSFMPYTASQIQAINAAMFNNNTNIQVSGYNYSWRLFGDNGFLNVSGKLYDTKGAVLEQANYNYNFSTAMPMNWDLISGSSNFSTAHKFDTLGSLEFSATGSDSLSWSGYYGPRIRDINVSFNYSIIPTAPTTPTLTTTNTNTVISDAVAEATNPVVTETPATTSVVTTTPITETVTASSTPTTTSSTTSSTSVATISPTVSTVSPATTSSSSSSSSNNSSSAPSLSSVMAMIQSNQARENNIAMSAVAQANEVAQTAVAQAEKTAIETASTSLAQSLDVAKDSAKSETKDNKTNVNSSLSLLPSSSGPFVVQGSSNIVQQSQLLSNQFNLPVNPFNNQQQSSSVTNNSLTSTSGLYNRPEVNISLPPTMQEMAQQSEIKSSSIASNTPIQQVEQPNNSVSLFAKRGDPLTDYIEQNNILVAMAQPETKSTTVKTNVQDNDLAGIVRIERMAVTPVGFSVYSLALRDVAFYQPKEIYKNVVIKDNVRTMYFIEKGNTDTYNKMIEGQYK